MTDKIIKGIDLLPHREPFLFLDNLLSYDTKSCVGEVTYGPDRDFFRGHFPEFPVVPGVILLESMAQVAAAGVLACQRDGLLEKTADIMFFASADNVRFRRPVRPGDKMTTHIETLRYGHGFSRVTAKGYIGDELAIEATISSVAKRD